MKKVTLQLNNNVFNINYDKSKSHIYDNFENILNINLKSKNKMNINNKMKNKQIEKLPPDKEKKNYTLINIINCSNVIKEAEILNNSKIFITDIKNNITLEKNESIKNISLIQQNKNLLNYNNLIKKDITIKYNNFKKDNIIQICIDNKEINKDIKDFNFKLSNNKYNNFFINNYLNKIENPNDIELQKKSFGSFSQNDISNEIIFKEKFNLTNNSILNKEQVQQCLSLFIKRLQLLFNNISFKKVENIDNKIIIELYPPSLGKVNVTTKYTNNKIEIKIKVFNENTLLLFHNYKDTLLNDLKTIIRTNDFIEVYIYYDSFSSENRKYDKYFKNIKEEYERNCNSDKQNFLLRSPEKIINIEKDYEKVYFF